MLSRAGINFLTRGLRSLPRRMGTNHTDAPSNSTNSDVHTFVSLMEEGIPPKLLLSHLAPSLRIPPDADDVMLWRMLLSFIDPPKRKKLTQYNTLDDAIDLIKKSNKIVVLSGAGISTSAGLPDFRSRNGIYVQIHAEHPDLADPKLMFEIDYFRKNPLPFYQFAKALYPGQFSPTLGHKFIKCIEDNNKLLRNYTQNIDTLEQQAGIKRVVECHGSFARATCTNCRYSVDGNVIKDEIMNHEVPFCPECQKPGSNPEGNLAVMKPNIVFFGEQLGDDFHNSLEVDKSQVDLLIVIGSSLKVKPVAMIPKSIPAEVPQILINKEPLDHMNFDIEFLGDCDIIIEELCSRLGGDWSGIHSFRQNKLREITGIPTSIKPQAPEVSIPGNTSSELNLTLQTEKVDKLPKTQSRFDGVSSTYDATDDDAMSLNTNRAEKDSLSTTQNTIEESDLPSQKEEPGQDSSNMSEGDDWEDIEVLDSSSSSSDEELNYSRQRAEIEIPESSYIFVAPNHYLFQGVELTNGQLSNYTKENK